MTQNQKASHQRHAIWKPLFLLGIPLLLLSSGAVVWILNIIGLLTGSWSTILPVIFTALSVMLSLLQWLFPFPSKKGEQPSPSPLVQRSLPDIQTLLRLSKRKGALLLLIGKEFQGASLHLSRGFDREDVHPDLATNIVLREIDNVLTGVGMFAALEPGNYTMFLSGEEQLTNVSIQAGQVAEVDWRSLHKKKRLGL